MQDWTRRRNEKVEGRIQNTEECIAAMLKLHTKLEDKLLDLESRSRCENMRIYGVPEGVKRDSTMFSSFVENLLREGLELNEEMPDLQMEIAGQPPPDEAPPRTTKRHCSARQGRQRDLPGEKII